MKNLILCGGSGTRLWPLSRESFPKQFCKINDTESLFQKSVIRNHEFCDDFMIITNQNHYFLALDQLAEIDNLSIDNCQFLLEPVGRNTAPAIALACLALDPEEIVFVTPSDHLILNLNAYRDFSLYAEKIANEGKIVTFGIQPTFAETGYGYIEAGDSLDSFSEKPTYNVNSFKEKPDQRTATEYLNAGNYYWNSGMFVFKAGIYLAELKKLSPKIYEKSVLAYEKFSQKSQINDNVIRISKDDMKEIPADSIDYAVMEKSNLVTVIPVEIDWNDLGSFDSLYEVLDKDEQHNTTDENIISVDSKNNLFLSKDRIIAAVDVEDLIVVDTADALLVSKKGSSQKVKTIVNELSTSSNLKFNELAKLHTTVARPWGTYTVLEEGDNYKIKRIVVKKGERLSLQKHFHRSEHWVVINGTAVCTIGKEEKLVRANESIFIPMGEIHRLENPGKIDLAIIEVQVGEYVGEDDIKRYTDDYGRTE